MASDQPTLGTRIRRARERARLSQEELAKAVGASKRAVGDWENDRRKPRNRLGAIEEVLGVRLDAAPDEPEMPTPEELARLQEHIREVLGDDAENFIRMMDEALAGKPPSGPRRGAGPGRAESGRARWSGSEQQRKRLP